MKRILRYIILTLTIILAIMPGYSQIDRGPFWRMIQSPSCNNIQCLELNPNNELFAGIWNSGVWYLNNPFDNNNWVKKDSGLTSLYISEIIHDDFRNSYVATLDNGVYCLENGSDEWYGLNNGLENLCIKSIAAFKTGDLIAGTYGYGLYYYDRFEKKWSEINKFLFHFDINTLFITEDIQDTIVFAGSNGGGIFRSSDYGRTWGHVLEEKIITAFAKSGSGDIYASSLGNGVYYSSDKGMSWNQIDNNDLYYINDLAITSDSMVAGTFRQGIFSYINRKWELSRDTALGVNSLTSNNGRHIFASLAYDGFLKSNEWGRNWFRDDLETTFAMHSGLRNLTVQNKGMLLASNYLNPDGKQTNKKSRLHFSTDEGRNWSVSDSINAEINALAFDSTLKAYIASDEGIYISDTAKIRAHEAWQKISAFDTEPVNNIQINSSGDIIVSLDLQNSGVSEETVYISTDGGNNFVNIYESDSYTRLLGIFDNDDIYIFDGGKGIVRIESGNTNPQTVYSSTAEINSFAYDSSGVIYFGAELGLLRTDDTCTTWTIDNYNSTAPQTEYVIVTPNDGIFIARSSDNAILRKKTPASQWELDTINTGIKAGKIESMAFHPKGYLFVSTTALYRTAVESVLKIPALVSPADNELKVNNRPVLRWEFDKTAMAEMYEIQLWRTDNDVEPVETAITANNYFYINTLLGNTAQYKWRCRSKVNRSYSEWSEYRTFTTGITGPELVFPENNSSRNDTSLTFQWNYDNSYNFNVTIYENDETNIIYNGTAITGLSLNSTANNMKLKPNTTYYWKVKASKGADETSWSDLFNFVTKYEAPELFLPIDNDDNATDDLLLEWYKSEQTLYYVVQLARDTLFTDIISIDTTDELSLTKENLEFLTKYYWRVKGYNEKNESFWSEVRSFTIFPGYPIPYKPENNSTVYSSDIIVNWNIANKNFDQYRLQISDSETFTNTIFDDVFTDRTYFQTDDVLDFCKDYYWRVKYIVQDKNYPWSYTMQFRTEIDKAVISYPSDNQSEVEVLLVLEWNDLGTDSYQLRISKDASFTEDKIIIDSEYDINYSDEIRLDTNTDYYWRVRGLSDDCYGEWSDVSQFKTTDKEVSVLDGFDSGLNVNLYPNPAHENVNISIHLANSDYLSLKLIDIFGNENQIAGSKLFNPGRHIISVPTGDLPGSVYFIEIKSSTDVVYKKLIID